MKTFNQIIGRWRQLAEAMRERIDEMPEFAEAHAKFEALIAEAMALASQQEKLRGSLRKTTRLRQEMERTGEESRQRLAAAMQYKLGFKDEDLIGFGIAPRITRRRTASEGETPASPATDTPQDTLPQ